MTVVVAVNAMDSIVLASDSATSQMVQSQDGQSIPNNIWNSASKIFNLRKAWPIAAVTWGRASIDNASIATLAKELRSRFNGERTDHSDWALDADSYTIQQVAERTKAFFYEEHDQHDDRAGLEGLGIAVAGYSARSGIAELFLIRCCQDQPERLLDGGGAWWHGQTEAITRLVLGVSNRLRDALVELGADSNSVAGHVDEIIKVTSVPVVFNGMPIGEVIDLAEFLVDVTIKFVRFTPGHPVVGGPIEIASMTRHEGFKWIKRKYYYRDALNPQEVVS
jgi:hypothetical protein